MYDLRTGMSLELADITEEILMECRDSGVYSIDPGLSKNFTMENAVSRLSEFHKKAEKYGVFVECIHLPYYGVECDISSLSEEERRAAVRNHGEIMKICEEVCPPNYFCIHPSGEPVSDETRQERLENARESLSALKHEKLLVENLPRTCLANTTIELFDLIASFDDLHVCCDVNHLLRETPQSALLRLKGRVKHLHISDNDGVDERHRLPGEGVIEWNKVIGSLEKIGYDQVFNYEVRKYSPREVAENKKKLFASYNNGK